MNNNPVIDIKKLDHYFGKGELRKQILFDINLTLKSGEVVILNPDSALQKVALNTTSLGLIIKYNCLSS